MSIQLNSNAPSGPIETAWSRHKFDIKVVNPANKRKYTVIVVGTGLALIAFNRIIQRTTALFASTVTYIIPIFATMWGWLDDEPLTVLHLVGGLVVLVGVRLVNRGGK